MRLLDFTIDAVPVAGNLPEPLLVVNVIVSLAGESLSQLARYTIHDFLIRSKAFISGSI